MGKSLEFRLLQEYSIERNSNTTIVRSNSQFRSYWSVNRIEEGAMAESRVPPIEDTQHELTVSRAGTAARNPTRVNLFVLKRTLFFTVLANNMKFIPVRTIIDTDASEDPNWNTNSTLPVGIRTNEGFCQSGMGATMLNLA
ncbi:MAG: hypothetical protein ACREBA_00905 [Nitrosotalea sp.]